MQGRKTDIGVQRSIEPLRTAFEAGMDERIAASIGREKLKETLSRFL